MAHQRRRSERTKTVQAPWWRFSDLFEKKRGISNNPRRLWVSKHENNWKHERLLEVWLLYGFEKASVRTIKICVGGLFIPDKLWRLLRKQTKCPLNPMLDTYSPFKRSNHTGFETTPSRILLNLPFSLTKNDAPPVAATGVAGKGLQSRFSYLASGCDFFFAIPARLSYSSLGVFLNIRDLLSTALVASLCDIDATFELKSYLLKVNTMDFDICLHLGSLWIYIDSKKTQKIAMFAYVYNEYAPRSPQDFNGGLCMVL